MEETADIEFGAEVNANEAPVVRLVNSIYEMMLVTDEIKEPVLKRVSTGELSWLAEERGMVRSREDGLFKAARSATMIEEVLRTVV